MGVLCINFVQVCYSISECQNQFIWFMSSSGGVSKHDTKPNVGLMLDQRPRRWSNINPTLGERLVFAGGHCPPL